MYIHRVLPAMVWIGMGAALAQAAGPGVAQLLELKPSQPGVVCDTPAADTFAQCKIEALRKPQAGYRLRDGRGLVVREFVDTNGDNELDRWSYFANGHEVYRDLDTNGNGRPDQFRWFHTGGSRWGVAVSTEGKVERWKMISTDECGSEVVAAIAERDFERLRRVLLGDEDQQALGLEAAAIDRVKKSRSAWNADFEKLTAALAGGVTFVRFDGHNPMAVPAGEVGADKDLVVFQNATIIVESGGQTKWLRIPEIVKVGDTWKLSDVPNLIDAEKTVATAGVLIPAVENSVIGARPGGGDNMIEENEEIQKNIALLQKLDGEVPGGDDVPKLVEYHTRRAEICATIGSKSKKLKNREHWYKQTADSLNAAAQSGGYPAGIEMLEKYSDSFKATNWGKNLAAYFKYRAVNAAYSKALNDPSGPHAKAQEEFLAKLKQFVADFPEVEDCGDALWQLGNGAELANKEDDAKAYYNQLVSQFPKSHSGPKGAGALRRLESVGKPFAMSGKSMTGSEPVDTAAMRGSVVLIAYWATWCEPCKAEMPKLQKLREKYQGQGFEIVGVCLDNDRAAAAAFLQKAGHAWPQIFEEGSMDSAPASHLGILSLPYMMLVDAEGRVLNKNLQSNALESEVDKAVAKKVANKKE